MHIRCYMGVGVEREACIGMPKDSRQRFGIHTACERMGSEGVPEIVKAYIGKSCFLKQLFHFSIRRRRCYGKFGTKRIGEDPLRFRILFTLSQHIGCADRQIEVSLAFACFAYSSVQRFWKLSKNLLTTLEAFSPT